MSESTNSTEFSRFELNEIVRQLLDFRGRTPKKLGMDWGGGDIRSLSANNVQKGYVDFGKDAHFGSDALYERWMTKGDCKKGDLLFTTEAPLGNVAQIPDDRKYILSQRTILIKFDEKLADATYMCQLFQSHSFQSELIKQSSGTTVVGIQQARLARIKLEIPLIPEQKKIARILTTIDNLIEKTEALIAKYKSIKQGMMNDLFTRGVDQNGRLRPPYEQAPQLYKDSELGKIPKDWEEGSLGDIADLQVGYAFKSVWFREDGGIKLLRGENVGTGHPDWKDTKYLDVGRVSEFSEFLLSAEDIVIGMDRTFTKSGVKITVLAECDVPCLLVQRVGRFIATKCSAAYLKAQLGNPSYHADLKLQQKGMDIPHLSKSEILAPKIPIPTLDEQPRIARILKSLRDRVDSEKRRVFQVSQIKKGLMQDLLTGKVRVNVDELEEELTSV